ncbi:MAG TPA: nucleotidyltransferase domain-containing protein, partial [Kiritimatiellia bacterium]|nr:nucleotidyltransferase domain-containing protein [Kiritimatiellia bacterium]
MAPACTEFNVRRLDVFGSVARGVATEDGDLDLAVEFLESDAHPAKS